MIDGEEAADKNDPIKVMNPRMRHKMAQDKKKREREMLKKKMAAGVDFLADVDIKLGEESKEGLTLTMIFDKILDIIDGLKPFKKDIRSIQSNYDRSISLFYEIV
eukprot:CAMPEP_0170482032 /NCGR_PEP_ID=MMETSP0208-20121228/2232_1 /TAXON_ID=197538 /ORGANISM="Strombidium inclinatum, Strain S3" /LENGTH=104 /DNA_ID=CAMNT_0010754827 /DNA_START=701 /DNA_END=1015 /DNA_ORIENTATION=+